MPSAGSRLLAQRAGVSTGSGWSLEQFAVSDKSRQLGRMEAASVFLELLTVWHCSVRDTFLLVHVKSPCNIFGMLVSL